MSNPLTRLEELSVELDRCEAGVRQQFGDLRGDLSKLNERLDSLGVNFTEHKGVTKVQVCIYGAVGAAIPTSLAVLYMLLKGG